MPCLEEKFYTYNVGFTVILWNLPTFLLGQKPSKVGDL